MSALFGDSMMQMMPDFGDRDGNSIMMQTPIILDPINSANITDMKEFQKQTQQHLQQMMQQQHYQDLGQQQQQQQQVGTRGRLFRTASALTDHRRLI